MYSLSFLLWFLFKLNRSEHFVFGVLYNLSLKKLWNSARVDDQFIFGLWEVTVSLTTYVLSFIDRNGIEKLRGLLHGRELVVLLSNTDKPSSSSSLSSSSSSSSSSLLNATIRSKALSYEVRKIYYFSFLIVLVTTFFLVEYHIWNG